MASDAMTPNHNAPVDLSSRDPPHCKMSFVPVNWIGPHPDCSSSSFMLRKANVVVPAFSPSPFMGSPFPHYLAAVPRPSVDQHATSSPAAGQFQILMAGIS